MKELRVIIAGSREFNDYELLKREVSGIIQYDHRPKELIKIISGTARGADQLGERFGTECGYEVKRFPADWTHLKNRAGYERNKQMAQYAVEDHNDGVLIALWDGESKGTRHMINLAEEFGLDTYVIRYKELEREEVIER